MPDGQIGPIPEPAVTMTFPPAYEYFPLIPDSVNLVLRGHIHNAQIAYYSFRRHRWQGLWAPGQGWLPKYTKGVYEGRLVVSAGLSNTARVPRICNPTEVVYLESL